MLKGKKCYRSKWNDNHSVTAEIKINYIFSGNDFVYLFCSSFSWFFNFLFCLFWCYYVDVYKIFPFHSVFSLTLYWRINPCESFRIDLCLFSKNFSNEWDVKLQGFWRLFCGNLSQFFFMMDDESPAYYL